MKIKIVWNDVTWYSKILSVIFFLLIMPLTFLYIGKEFERTMAVYENLNIVSPQVNRQSFGSIKSILIERTNVDPFVGGSSQNGIVE